VEEPQVEEPEPEAVNEVAQEAAQPCQLPIVDDEPVMEVHDEDDQPEPVIAAAVPADANVIIEAVEPVEPVAQPVASAPVAVAEVTPYQDQMQSLADIGFLDIELNSRLLAKHNGDLQATITEILG